MASRGKRSSPRRPQVSTESRKVNDRFPAVEGCMQSVTIPATMDTPLRQEVRWIIMGGGTRQGHRELRQQAARSSTGSRLCATVSSTRYSRIDQSSNFTVRSAPTDKAIMVKVCASRARPRKPDNSMFICQIDTEVIQIVTKMDI